MSESPNCLDDVLETDRAVRRSNRERTTEPRVRSHLSGSVRIGKWCLLAVLVILSLATVAIAGAGLVEAASETEPPMPGDGTEDDPYEISNATELQQMELNLSAHYVLVADVTADGSFEPIGSDTDSAFTGTVDGNGHTISGLTIDENADYVGLFGVIGDGSQITDLALTSVDVRGDEHVGGLAGLSEGGTVHGVTATGTVSGDSSRVGGLLGANEKGTVEDSHASVSVSSGWSSAGGLVGVNDGWIVHSSADGTVSGIHQRVGGLVGWHTNFGEITFSHATGAVSSESSRVGGLVGQADERADITDSYATGSVSTQSNQAGGLVGTTADAYTRIERSYATGNVAGVSSDSGAVGGLVGDHGGHTIEQSYASGSVAGSDGIGGLVGSKSGDIIGSFAVGTVSGSENVGGLVGQNYGTGTVTDSYWDVPATEQESSDGGIGFGSLSDTAPAAEMIGENAVANMTGLDFDVIWDVRSDPDEYPALAHERFEETVPIKSCDVYAEIDVSGVYELQNNVSSDGTCIEVTADDVVLDGQGMTISGVDNPTSGEYAVHVDGATNVTVRNVTIETWDQGTGIYVEQASDVTVRNVEATDNRFAVRNRIVDGFTIDSVRAEGGSAPGLELVDASNGMVTDVTVIGTDSEDWGGAIRLSERWNSGTSNVTLDNVTAMDSKSAGISVEDGDVWDISITNSTAVGSDGSGIAIDVAAVDVTDSRVLDNGAYGIRLGEASETTLTNIESRENADAALRVDGSPDLAIEALDIGDSTAANTTLSIAEAVDVELGSVADPADPPADLAPIERYVTAEALSDDGLLDVSVGYETEDVGAIDESTLSLWADDGDWTEIEESTVDTGEQTVSAMIETFSTVGVFGEGDVSPSASFTFEPDQPTTGQQVTFDATDSSSPHGDIVEYRWDFTGDGTFEDTTADPEATWTFDEAGEQNVTLEIEDETDETAETTETVAVEESDDPEPNLSVVDATFDPDAVAVGDPITVTATVENTGEAAGEHTAALELDGTVEDTETVAVEPGETEVVEFTHTFEAAGEYEVSVDGFDAGTVSVSGPEPVIEVTDVSLSDDTVDEGSDVTVTATVENTGEAAGEHTLELELDGAVEDAETVEVEPGETEEVEFTHTFEAAGEYEVSVDGFAAGTVTVNEASTPSPPPSPSPVPDISVVDASVEETTAVAGENVTVTVTLENAGDADGDYEVTLNVDGTQVDSATASVGAGETTDLSFVHTFEEAGEYEVRVSDVQAVTVTVEGASDDLTPAWFDVTGLPPSVAIDEPGDSASISATVENTGDEPDTQAVEVTLDGDVVHEAEITLEAGETHTVSLDLETEALDYGATYEYTVSTQDDSETGVLDVGDQSAGDGDESDAGGDGTDDDAMDDGLPGFGVTAAVFALVSALVLATRGRRSRSSSPR
ncbi:CARDB domain-containing protein [Halovivax gelatinilyticus]|uniref:CARDB domain-containing protein n=1 Tax=Halovivax gelatinilyticus TaxID=2961597 RepID=UPI0020CA9BD9|nr:CARDB domain-containing protein [Halovivax gelatinilyticus]